MASRSGGTRSLAQARMRRRSHLEALRETGYEPTLPAVETEGIEPSLLRCERSVLPLALRPHQ